MTGAEILAALRDLLARVPRDAEETPAPEFIESEPEPYEENDR